MSVMKLKLRPSMTLEEAKKDFNEFYPFLRLEFFSKPHEVYKASPAKFIIHDETKTIGELLAFASESIELNIEGSTTVRKFEAEAADCGLYLQVLRRSAATWLATTVTDNLTLSEQNRKGEASTKEFPAPEDEYDYREQE